MSSRIEPEFLFFFGAGALIEANIPGTFIGLLMNSPLILRALMIRMRKNVLVRLSRFSMRGKRELIVILKLILKS